MTIVPDPITVLNIRYEMNIYTWLAFTKRTGKRWFCLLALLGGRTAAAVNSDCAVACLR